LWADFDEILWVDSCGGLYTQLYSPQFDYVLSRMRQSPDPGSGLWSGLWSRHVFKIARRI